MKSRSARQGNGWEPPCFSLWEGRQLIGAEAVAKLVLHFGGGRVFVPENGGPESVLARVIGEDAVLKLASVWGGASIAVPSNRTAVNRQAVLDRTLAGESVATIVRSTGLTERRVYQIRADLRADGRIA